MIQVFADIMLFGTGNAADLAGGISQALITTAAGLTIAIPAMMSHRYFERHVESLVVQLRRAGHQAGGCHAQRPVSAVLGSVITVQTLPFLPPR